MSWCGASCCGPGEGEGAMTTRAERQRERIADYPTHGCRRRMRAPSKMGAACGRCTSPARREVAERRFRDAAAKLAEAGMPPDPGKKRRLREAQNHVCGNRHHHHHRPRGRRHLRLAIAQVMLHAERRARRSFRPRSIHRPARRIVLRGGG
jgi:hypothetical protein